MRAVLLICLLLTACIPAGQVEEIKEELKEKDKALERCMAQTDEKDKQIDALRSRIDNLSQEYSYQVNKSSQEIFRLEQELELSKRQEQRLSGNIEEIQNDIDSVILRIEAFEQKVNQTIQWVSKK